MTSDLDRYATYFLLVETKLNIPIRSNESSSYYGKWPQVLTKAYKELALTAAGFDWLKPPAGCMIDRLHNIATSTESVRKHKGRFSVYFRQHVKTHKTSVLFLLCSLVPLKKCKPNLSYTFVMSVRPGTHTNLQVSKLVWLSVN
jgi:hypothetical protein